MNLRARLLALFGRHPTGPSRAAGEIMKAVRRFSRHRVGALIVVERAVSLERLLSMGVLVDCALRAEVLDTIYATDTYLQGGATIVRNDRIAAARVLLPLSSAEVLRPRDRRLGARHMAAAALTESTDAVCVVVSEETGLVSIAVDGDLRHVEDSIRGEEQLEELLSEASRRALRMPRRPVIDDLLQVVGRFTKNRVGSALVFERAVSLQPYVDRSVRIDAAFTWELVDTIFATPTLLHDGALIVRDGRIESAGAVLPLTQNPDVPKRYGTRHRAAIGISEETDAVVVVTSEETGTVSVCHEGMLEPCHDLESFRRVYEESAGTPI